MTEKPSPLIGTLVRFWRDGFRDNFATEWVDWDNGWFHQWSDSPLARQLSDAATRRDQITLTVYSTEELVWVVNSTSITDSYGRAHMTVHCVPWLEYLRHGLISDEYMVWLWLDAEKRHLEAS